MAKRLPPQVGLEANKPLLYNPYQVEFLKARRLRYATCCKKIGSCGSDGLFRCPSCGRLDMLSPRVYRRLGIFAGRRGGKSLIGAWGAREEMRVPNSLGWVCGPTFKILHDATMPTLLKLIPREWCASWDQDNLELTLVNGAQVQFRSLDDPDRGHAGVGVHWAWFDEAAFIAELAWDYFRPALTDHGGAAFFTSSVDSYDWTYYRIEKPALVDKKPGFWACKYRTIDNPYMAIHRADEIAEAKSTMPPRLFRQEYEAEREHATGSIYGEWVDGAWLSNDEEIRAYIPEWPQIDPSRHTIIGLDSGADHPFGALALVVTEKAIVAVAEYLERQRAFDVHLTGIRQRLRPGQNVLWAANRTEAQLRLEFAQHGILVAPAEHEHRAGIQRVLSWLYTNQLKIAYTCPLTMEQMKTYRYAENVNAMGEKTNKEKVFKKNDELPDCLRYALMTWPSLPSVPTQQTGQRNLMLVDERTRWEIQKMRRFNQRDQERDLIPANKEYPLGDFYTTAVGDEYDVVSDAESVFASGGW